MKTCKYCDKPLERKILPEGRKESITNYNKRLYCDQTCYGKSKLQEMNGRFCQYCDIELKPIIYPSGRVEHPNHYYKRQYCSRTCANQGRDKISRHNINTLVCKVCGNKEKTVHFPKGKYNTDGVCDRCINKQENNLIMRMKPCLMNLSQNS